jgi:hypothetical protein
MHIKQCAPAHCHGESTSPGSAIVPDVFGGHAAPVIAKPPNGMLVNHLAWKNKFLMNSALSQKRLPTCSWCANYLTWLSLDVERMGFSTKSPAVCFLGHTRKSWFNLSLWSWEEFLVISDFIHFLAHKHTLLLLLINEQLRHKLHENPPHDHTLNSSTTPAFWPRSQDPATGPMWSHLNPVHILTSNFFNFYFNIFFTSLAR